MGTAMMTCAALAGLTATAVAAPPVAPVIAPDAAKLAAALHDLGSRALAEAVTQATPIDPPAGAPPAAAGHALIDALGPCVRPSYDERVKLGEQLARRVPHQGELAVQFGCKDAAGTVVALQFDQPPPRAETGVWRVVRVAPSGITTLAEDTGPARSTWQELVQQVVLLPIVELDFDGDRIGDVVIARIEHEGGAHHGNAGL